MFLQLGKDYKCIYNFWSWGAFFFSLLLLLLLVCFLNKRLDSQSLHFVYFFIYRDGWGVRDCADGISTL